MNRNTNMIITIVLALVCLCCSAFTCIMGFGGISGTGTYSFGGVEQPMPPTAGYVLLCLSVILLLVPVAVGFFLLRKKPGEAEAPSDEPPAPVA